MRALRVPDIPTLRDALREELHHSAHARYLNRLHCLLLMGCGHSCYQIAKCLGESPRALELWVHRYREEGINGLKDHPRATGRGSRKLTQPQLKALEQDLLKRPDGLGYEKQRWDGALLKSHLEREYSVSFSARHCRRLLHQTQG